MKNKLVQVEQNESYVSSNPIIETIYEYRWASPIVLPFRILFDTANTIHNGNIVLSTWRNISDGSLTYCRTESHEKMCDKVPDMELVGGGKWIWSNK